jgi:cobalt-zinc-cadmium efflux system membrane fusion protein
MDKVRVLGLPKVTVDTLDPKTAPSNLIPLLAPFDGVVVDKDMVAGEFVNVYNNMNPRRPHFTVADVNRMEVLLDVRQEDIGKVKLGQELTFRADGDPDVTAAGPLCWISSEADEKTRTIRVKAHVPNPDGKLRAHIFGTGRIFVRSVPQAVVVPDDAVQADDACRMVFVRLRDSNEFQARLVETGIRADGYTQIVSGLKAGEEVVTTGSHALKSEIVKGRIAADE